MALGKWIFSQTTAPPTEALEPRPIPIPCADGKQFGLENFGNTCYANSVLQALYFCSPFRELVIQHPDLNTLQSLKPPTPTATHTSPSPSSPPHRRRVERRNTTDSHPNGISSGPTIPTSPRTLFSALRSLYIHISDNPVDKGTVAPRAFIDKLKELNELFRSTMHQDAHEFSNYLLNRIVEEMEDERKHYQTAVPSGDDLPNSVRAMSMTAANSSSSGGPSQGATFIHKIFEGILTSETRCLTCENVSARDESFLDLSIDIEQNSSVTACLRQFSASEMLCQKNKFFCDSCCDLQEAEKRMKIKRLPNVLALHLKRFKYQEDVQKYIKLAYRVAFPFELRLFNTVDDAQNPDRLYELFAIVVHIGTGPHHGHYVSIIRTMGFWLIFDDDTVDTIKESDIPKYFGDSNSGSAYVLYYQAVDLDLAALGLRPTSSEPHLEQIRQQQVPRPHRPTDSPNTLSHPIPAHPPGLTPEEGESSETSDYHPPHASPIPIARASPDPGIGKSPRKANSQIRLNLSSSPSSAATGVTGGPNSASPISSSSMKNGLFHPLRNAPSMKISAEKRETSTKSSSSPIPSVEGPTKTGPVPPLPPGLPNGKDKEGTDKKGTWFRRKSIKNLNKARPTSEAIPDTPTLHSDGPFSSVTSPSWLRGSTVSIKPSNTRRPSELPEFSRDSTSSSVVYVRSKSSGGPSSKSREHSRELRNGKEPSPPDSVTSSFASSSGGTVPSQALDFPVQSSALSTIPASPSTSNFHEPPPSAFSRGFMDPPRGPRVQGPRVPRKETREFERSPSPPKVPVRPSTAGAATTRESLSRMAIDRSLPPLPGINGQMTSMQGSGDSTYPRKSNPIRTRGKVDGHGNDEPTLQRPKSAHASVGLAVDPTADIGGTPSPSVSTTSSNTKRGSRKLSLTAPILGFGRKKEKDKEREKKAKPVAPPSAFLSPYLSPKY